MKKSILDLIFASEKRRNVLLLLKDGPSETQSILDELRTTRQALLPQTKILEQYHLVSHYEDTYELTTIGRIVVDKMFPLLKATEVLDTDISYWGTHKLDFIPADLLERIDELGEYDIINPPITEIYELNEKVNQTCCISRAAFLIASTFHPKYPELFSELVRNNVNVCAIFSKDVLLHLQSNYFEYLKELVDSQFFSVFIYPEKMDFMAFVYNDHCILMRLLKSNGEHDSKYILSSNPANFDWPKELFEYYLKDSLPLDEV